MGRLLRLLGLVVILGACSLGSDPSDDLQGRWSPVQVPSEEFGPEFDLASAIIEFDDDGTWSAWDGCHRLVGSYALEKSGDFTMEATPMIGGGCTGGGEVPYAHLLAGTDEVQFDEGRARFTDGDELLLELEAVPQ